MTVADTGAAPLRVLYRAGAVLLGAGLAAGLTALVAVEIWLVVALPTGVALVASLIRDARITDRRALELDLAALATANALALAAATLTADLAAILLLAAVAGSALGFVGARGWTIYLSVLVSVGMGFWGLLFGPVFVPAVIAGVVARPDARP